MQALYGRDREFRVLDDLLDGVNECGAALVVRGEAGVGKSALLASASARAKAQGMLVLTATGVEAETHLPFAGLHQLLSSDLIGPARINREYALQRMMPIGIPP